jgi:hypothetical protein
MSNTLWLSLPGITGEPKVTDLERHISVEEHVAQLEVPVENPLQVNVPTQFTVKMSVWNRIRNFWS